MTRSRSGKFYLVMVVLAILGWILFLDASLNYLNYARNLKSLTNTRFGVIAQELINSVEYGLNLGLNLREISTIQNLLAETKQQNADITELFVIDEQVGLLFQGKTEGKKLDADLAGRLSEVNLNTFTTLVYDNTHFLIYPLTNQFNVRVGSLFLGYSSDLTKGVLGRALERFVLRFIIVFAVCGVVIVGIYGAIYSGFLASLKEVQRLLDALAHRDGAIDESRDESGDKSMDESYALTIFGPGFSEFCQGSRRLTLLLDEAERSMERIEKKND